jgi:segregation and condensation protein A
VTRLERVKVWEIQLSTILREFTQMLRQQGYIDLNAAGIAILSAATIHRIKTEKLLAGDEPPAPHPKPELIIPPAIMLPVKPEVITSTIEELVHALKTALTQASSRQADTVQPQVVEHRLVLTDFLIKIEQELENFLALLDSLLAQRYSILFSEMVRGKSKIEAAKIFILLLFAAARGRVLLLQEDESEDLTIVGAGVV